MTNFLGLLVIALLLLCAPGWAAVTFDAVSNSTCLGCSSLTFSHTTTSGADRAIAVGVCVVGGAASVQPATTSVTYAGVNLASKKKETGNYYCELWSLADGTMPATGANDVIITLAGTTVGASSRILGAAITVTGVNQTTAWTSSNNGASGVTGNVVLTLSGNNAVDLAVYFACHGSGFAAIPGGDGETQRFANDDGGTACSSFGVATGPGGDTVLSWPVDGDDSFRVVGGAFNGASGAAAAPAKRRPILY